VEESALLLPPPYRHVVCKKPKILNKEMQRVKKAIEAQAMGLPLEADCQDLLATIKGGSGAVLNDPSVIAVEMDDQMAIRVGPAIRQKAFPKGTMIEQNAGSLFVTAAFEDERGPEWAFMEGRDRVLAMFRKRSDEMMARQGRDETFVLVTIVQTTVTVWPLVPKGFQVGCEFQQYVYLGDPYFGEPGALDFEIESERGDYPVTVPSSEIVMFMMQDASDIVTPAHLGRDRVPGTRGIIPATRDK
jgi:hypothetical protein